MKSKLTLAAALIALSFGAFAADKSSPSITVKPALAPAAQASAGSPPPHAQMNGIPEKITRAEAIKRATDQFDMVDTNHDGVVTREEIMAFQAKMQQSMSVGGPAAAGAPGKASVSLAPLAKAPAK